MNRCVARDTHTRKITPAQPTFERVVQSMDLKRLSFQLYGILPVPLQNAAISAWGYRAKATRYGRAFWHRLEWLEQTQWWTDAEVKSYQADSLRKIVDHAFATVPFYRARFQAQGLRPSDIQSPSDLHKLPVLSKNELRAVSVDTIVSSAYSKRDLVSNLTSGTTGSPFRVWLTREAVQFQWAVWWRHKRRFGLEPGDKYLTFGARLPIPARRITPPFWRHNHAFNQTYLSTYHLTPSALSSVAGWLAEEEFRFFTGYPSAMYVVASFMKERGVGMLKPPSVIVSGSDALLPAFEEAIGAAFRAPVTDQYGSAEACGNFARCELGKYHLDAEFGLAELLPIPGCDNPRLRRIVFTGFANPAMPFIRYDTGDIGLLSEGRCSCGRSTPSLDRVDGRTEDFVRTPDGRMVIGLNQAFEWAPGIEQTQVVQDRVDELTVLVVPSKVFGKSDLKILEYELRQRVGSEIKIDFRVVDKIGLSAAGKYRAVISRVPVVAAAEMSQRRMIEHGIAE